MTAPRPGVFTAMTRGFSLCCPNCGKGALFRSLLKLTDNCPVCGEKLGDIRADDVPAYFTILIVGHIVVPALLIAERYDFSSWAELSVAVPATLALTWLLLPRVKGAIAALLWHLNLRDGAPA
ncbi:MAG TPA: DUF983 domain-containing protein [Aliidongia sp.]|nr:DUF983 domain-containing protein [Aliidongia sp.]